MRLTDGLLPVLLIVIPAGCAKSPGPDLLHIDAASYHDAFDAAMEASRAHGLPLALRDRRGGVIETEPAPAASILEPWHSDNATMGQSLENTIAYQRRRARFEFAPAAAAPAAADLSASSDPQDDDPDGPDLLGVETRDLDLTAYDGELELRVRVIVERAHTMGVRRSTWSRRSTSRGTIDSATSDGEIPSSFWTPVARDEAFERRLLVAVDNALRKRASE
jgi:hypothetical protein